MAGSGTSNFSAALPVIGKRGPNVEAVAVKPHGPFPTPNATSHSPARRNHRTCRHTSNSTRLSRHNSSYPHHHIHNRCFGDLHARTSRVRHCAKVRNTTGYLSGRCLQELPKLYTTDRLAISDDSAGNPLQCFQAHHS